MAIATGFGKALRARAHLQNDQGSERAPLEGSAVDRWKHEARCLKTHDCQAPNSVDYSLFSGVKKGIRQHGCSVMRRSLRVYQCRWQQFEWVVAASSKSIAAHLIGIPLHQMKEYGQLSTHQVARALAMSAPGSVWRRQCSTDPWSLAMPPSMDIEHAGSYYRADSERRSKR